MKRFFRDILGGLIVMLPFILLCLPLIIDVFAALATKSDTDSSMICYKYEAPNYEYNPHEEIIEKHRVYTMETYAYCPCERCCGWNTGITYSGTMATPGRTVACNLDRFSIGTELMIDGHKYIVEDTGNLSENMIDIYFDSHEEALQYGTHWKIIEVIEEQK